MTLTAGTRISHYEVIKFLGAGGMGEVYLARDHRLQRDVALKLLAEKLMQDRSSLNRFYREATSAAALRHPNICTIFEIGEEDNKTFIVMEYIEGTMLQTKIAGRRLPLAEVLEIAIQAADALEEARKKNIVHRDIKSANILVASRNQIKILDFGLAKKLTHVSADEMMDVSTDLQITTEGAILGTLSYMSPEQALGQEIDHRTDIYSLGVVLYEMITGRLPFDARSTAAAVVSIVTSTPPPISQLNPDAPEALIRIIEKMMAKKPADRYQSAYEVWTDLRAIAEGSRTTAVFYSVKRSYRNVVYVLLLAALTLLSAVLLKTFKRQPDSVDVRQKALSVQTTTLCYGIKTKHPKVIPFSLKNMMPTQDSLYWFQITAKNQCPDPLHLKVVFKVRHGPVVMASETPAEYTVYPGTILSQKIDPFFEFLSSETSGILEVIWRVYDHKESLLDTGTARIELLPKTTMDWSLIGVDGKAVSREFLVAALAAWAISPDLKVTEHANACLNNLKGVTSEPKRTSRWFQNCYESLLQGQTPLRIIALDSFPPDVRHAIQTPGQVLQSRQADPVEAGLLFTALSHAVMQQLKVDLSLILFRDPPNDAFRAFLSWRSGISQWQAIDLAQPWIKFEENVAKTTEQLIKMFSDDANILPSLNKKGVYIQDKRSLMAIDFRRAVRHFMIHGLP